MTRRIPLVLSLLAGFVLNGPIAGQYVIRSPYLSEPALAIPYVDSCAAFWSKAYDAHTEDTTRTWAARETSRPPTTNMW